MKEKQHKSKEMPKKILVKFGGDKMSGRTTLMMILMKELRMHKIKFTIGSDQHTLCVATKRKEIIDLIHELKARK